jgi:signal transduction histidine kinase
VRGLVEAHGGRVDAHNTGTGCRFVVRIPAAR